jgi:glycosyltransferase involved in cell wall biosynthesis
MRLLILDENYPHLENLMGDVFVHVRAKQYAQLHEVKVFSFFHSPKQICYENIFIEQFADVQTLVAAIKIFKPDKILIHFYHAWMLENVIKVIKVPVIIWVHGYEALGWYRRLFNYTWYSPVLLNYIYKNTIQQYHFSKLIHYANKTKNVRFVFVSDWMRKITEWDSFSKIHQYDIIPNPIDIDLFKYQVKDEELRKKILLLRSFSSYKYANDISADAIMKLSKRNYFKEFSFTIIGDGQLFESIIKPLEAYPNIKITKGVVQQTNIPEIHKEHGIFLCPTRQDAQGVSMCEAMSSGLVPVTSFSTAIPEFVTNNVSGILTKSSNQIADAIEDLFEHPDKFKKLSLKAAESINDLCNIFNVTNNELLIIES